MELRVGDTVRFLNETGGGTITRIVDAHFVQVLTGDGFEIPVLRKDLIVIPGNDSPPRVETSVPDMAQPAQPPLVKPLSAGREKESQGVYIAWVRVPGSLVTGEVDVSIVNHTTHDVLFNVLEDRQGEARGFEYGSLAPGAISLIQEWKGNPNEMLLSGTVQVMYHQLESGRIRLPLSAPFRVRSMRLLKEDAYRMTPFFSEPALLIYLGYEGEEQVPVEVKSTARTEKPPGSLLDQFIQAEGHAIVDLHLDKLVDSVRGISPAEALQIQLSFFNAVMDAAATKGVERIVFIHGVGNGILKSEIRKRLDAMEQVLCYDAPMSQYGVGATEVRIPGNVH